MKNIFTYSAFLFAVLFASVLAVNAQSTNAPAKQETTQQVAPAETFFQVESLDNARNKVEDAYIKFQNAPADKADALAAEFRHLRRMYLVELEQKSSAYPSDSQIGMKIHSEMIRASKDLR